METPDDNKRNEAIKGLMNIALIEGFVLMAVVGVYLKTNNITHLIVGIIGSTVFFGPMFFRWFKEHGDAMKSGGGK